jgi:hypothetical protein
MGGSRASVDRGIAQLKASWLLLEAPPGAATIPVNRDGEPEEASSRWVMVTIVLKPGMSALLLVWILMLMSTGMESLRRPAAGGQRVGVLH